MEDDKKRRATFFGIRIGIVFLAALATVIFAAYYVLSQNFHRLLTDYTVQLMRSMNKQGVAMVEGELASGRREVGFLAQTFVAPGAGEPVFPASALAEENVLRLGYATETGAVFSDGERRDAREREDVRAALAGETGVYGPYFDAAGRYVICYAAPVTREGKIVGALLLEKDAYLFSRLIRPICFANSGESYIIDTAGTDIAVSDPAHIEWVNTRYNGRRLLAEKEDPTTRSVVELEQRGLDGETGVGSYLWNDGICYVAYAPIPPTGWVLLTGLREEEIADMTQNAFYASVSRGPLLGICFASFLLLTGLIIYWIISSTKKNAEINEKLEKIANHDALTGLLNRRFFENDLAERWRYPISISGQAAVFMLDIDDFKRYNDSYGHQKGDDCIRMVAGVFKHTFAECESYVLRYGGEELVATAFLLDRQTALEKGREICRAVAAERWETADGKVVTVSVGVCHVNLTREVALYDCVKAADQALYRAKREGKDRAALLCIGPEGIFDPADEDAQAEATLPEPR